MCRCSRFSHLLMRHKGGRGGSEGDPSASGQICHLPFSGVGTWWHGADSPTPVQSGKQLLSQRHPQTQREMRGWGQQAAGEDVTAGRRGPHACRTHTEHIASAAVIRGAPASPHTPTVTLQKSRNWIPKDSGSASPQREALSEERCSGSGRGLAGCALMLTFGAAACCIINATSFRVLSGATPFSRRATGHLLRLC